MNATIITIGDELISGKTANTNGSYIADFLVDYGIPVNKIFIIGDDKGEILATLATCTKISDLVFITGGLGPTHDDITKNAAVEFFQSPLKFYKKVEDRIRQRFILSSIPVTDANKSQAYYPDEAELVPNSIGTAEGMKFYDSHTTYYFLPGVPSEMKKMMKDHISFDLKKISSVKINRKTIHTFGLPESNLYSLLEGWVKAQKNITVSFLPKFTGIDIGLTVKNDTDGRILNNAISELNTKLGDLIFGHDDDTLEAVVAELLIHQKKTIAVAESCTGGNIANLLTNISGSSKYFMSGLITYSNESKNNLLEVNKHTIDKYGAVSSETAMEMAKGVRRLSKCDIGLSSTGIAGPIGGTENKPVGTLFVGIAMKNCQKSFKLCFNKDRLANKIIFTQFALNNLRICLNNEAIQ